MNKREFNKELKGLGFTQIKLCTGESTDYFFMNLQHIRVIINRHMVDKKLRYRLYFRDVKDDNWINNILVKEFIPDDKFIKSLKKTIKFLGESKCKLK